MERAVKAEGTESLDSRTEYRGLSVRVVIAKGPWSELLGVGRGPSRDGAGTQQDRVYLHARQRM